MYVNNKYLIHLDTKNSKKCEEKAAKMGAKIVLYITNDKEYKWLFNKTWIDEFIASYSTNEEHKNINFVKTTKGKRPWHTMMFWKSTSNMSIDGAVVEGAGEDEGTGEDEANSGDFIPCLNFEGVKTDYEYKLGELGLGYYKIQTWSLPVSLGRKTIPKQLRGTVWRNYFNTLDNQCPLCGSSISIDDFECGHIISVKNGGSNHPNNLMPLCGKCNKSMSFMNMDDYCKQYGITIKKN